MVEIVCHKVNLPAKSAKDTVVLTKREIAAIKAVALGQAHEMQQKEAMNAIIHAICRLESLSFDPISERVTVFLEGRRFVGRVLVDLIKKKTQKDDDL